VPETASPTPDLERHQDLREVREFLRSRSEGAFVALYRRHSPRLFSLIRRLLGRRGRLAEDVLQETWVRAVRALPEFRWEASLGAWLRGIAVNRCRELFRREARDQPAECAAEPAASDSPRPSARLVDLERALDELPDGFRMVLLLHDVEGLTHEEIALRLGIAEGTSKSQLSRARRAVRERLEGSREVSHGQPA
jgi:RNA polymerase sigma-70 factor, ECF subfamily